jgi:hypothetical protein
MSVILVNFQLIALNEAPRKTSKVISLIDCEIMNMFDCTD